VERRAFVDGPLGGQGIAARLTLVAILLCVGGAPARGDAAAPRSSASPPARLVPSAPGATHYRSRATNADGRDLAADPLRAAILAAVRAQVRRDGLTLPRADARLDRAMNDFARVLGPDDLPAPEAVAFLLAHYGLPDPPPHWLMERMTPGADQLIAERTAPAVLEALKSTPVARIGVGIDRAAAEVRVVVAVQGIDVEIDPIPRQLPPGGRTTIAGRVEARFREPRVVVTAPDGSVREHGARGTVGKAVPGRFSDEVRCDAGPGCYQVEIAAATSAGPAVLANFPLFCGVPPPGEAPGPATVRPTPMTAAEAETRLLALVNRDRVAAHRKPLVLDARLSEIARAHSRDMAEHQFVAHVSPRTGSAAERVARAGLAPALLLENVGRAYSAEDAESGFMASPGHRGNILDVRATRIGIGIAIGREVNDMVPLLVTQLMM
jgi:uncharacterized protein YkwD